MKQRFYVAKVTKVLPGFSEVVISSGFWENPNILIPNIKMRATTEVYGDAIVATQQTAAAPQLDTQIAVVFNTNGNPTGWVDRENYEEALSIMNLSPGEKLARINLRERPRPPLQEETLDL